MKFMINSFLKKRFYLSFLILVIFVFLFFPSSSQADFLGIISAVLAIPLLIAYFFLGFFILISVAFASLMAVLLDWVISPNFIGFSYTNPANNPVIEIGLSITQGLVNVFLVLVLIYTAISIALKLLGETEAKKMLARLILVALLVNFAPVLLGLIVDAANITMNYFLSPLREAPTTVLAQATDLVWAKASDVFKFKGDVMAGFGLIAQGVVSIFFMLAMGIAFFLFTGIFVFRYFAIWILVILAPLAFVAWIAPFTKNLWSLWWNNFLQWSIIGIPMAFFLFLGLSTFGVLTAGLIERIAAPGMDIETVTFFDEIVPFVATVVFLILGFVVGLSSSAFGASTAISLTQRAGKFTARTGARIGRRAAGRLLGAKGTGWMEKQAAAKFMPEKIQKMKGPLGALAKAGYGISAALPVYALRRGIGEAGLRLTEGQIKDIGDTEKKYKETTAERKLAGIRDAFKTRNFGKATGILKQGIEEEQIDDLREMGLKDEEITKIGKESLRTHPEQFKKIRNTFPHLAEKMAEGFSDKVKKSAGLVLDKEEIKKGMTIPMKIMAKIKPEFIPQMGEASLLQDDIQNFFHNFATPAQVSALLEKGPAKAKDLYITAARKLTLKHYDQRNPSLANYFRSNPGARALGGPLEEKTKEEIEAEEKRKERWSTI